MARPLDGTPSLARGAAVMTIVSAASRVTGVVRVVVVAAAMGTTFLANTYQTANTAPNVLFELVAAGVLTSIFVPTFVDHLVRGEPDEGWRVANVLTSVALAALLALSLMLALLAPVVMTLLTAGVEDASLRAREVALGSAFLRLFAPQIVLYGAGMIMTAALHAHGRFGIAAVAPIFNNLVVTLVYVLYALMRGDRPPTVAGITTAETIVLGAGTTLGVVAMTLCLVPTLRGLGWRFRWSFRPRHHAVRKALRLGTWALGYAGGYQAGLIVVLVLANRVEGGVAAYQWAYTFFYVPHALFGVPLFNVLFPAMSEHALKGEHDAFFQRLRDGLTMLAFMLLPVAAAIVVTAHSVARLTFEYGVMSGSGAALVGRVLTAFALGLPTYSAFLALTRAFYAVGDTKTPALVNAVAVVLSSVVGAALFGWLPSRWAVPGLAAGHSIGFALASAVLYRALTRRSSSPEAGSLGAGVARAFAGALVACAVMALVHVALPATSKPQAVVNVIASLAAGAASYLGLMSRMRSRELARLRGLVSRPRT